MLYVNCVPKENNSIYFDTKHSDSNQRYSREFKKHKSTHYISAPEVQQNI